MGRLLGVLLMVVAVYAVLVGMFPFLRTAANHQYLARELGFYGVLTLGVGVLIVSGGIDVSIGSLVGLGAVAFGKMLDPRPAERLSPSKPAALVIVALAGLAVAASAQVLRKKMSPGAWAVRLGAALVGLAGVFALLRA